MMIVSTGRLLEPLLLSLQDPATARLSGTTTTTTNNNS